MHNRLIKNKFLRENLILVIVLTLIFPPYLFSDAWVADTGNKQVSRLYKEGHAPTRIKVANNTAPVLGDTEICVNLNPTALFYPGLKLSFGDNRKDVYEIQSIRYDASIPATPWIVGFYNLKHADVTDSPIYMELVRAAGFESPIAVSANQSNERGWFTDNSSVTQINGWGRDEPPDTAIVTPYYHSSFGFEAGDTMFKLYSEDTGIYQGIKLDFKSDNRDQTDTYVLEVKDVDRTTPIYTLTTVSGLPGDHSIIGEETSVLHIDRFRDKAPISPQDVSCSSNSDESDLEYDIAWVADTGRNSVKKFEKWGYRRKLSIDPTGKIVGETLQDFPLCVKLNPSRIDYTNTHDYGADIRFTDSLGKLLKYEIEKWDSTGTSIVWVNVPEISQTDTTIIYMYYGNPNVDDKQDTRNVWDSNYAMVQHLEEMDTRIYDSTFNRNDGTSYGADFWWWWGKTPILHTDSGLIDGACQFDIADSEYIGIRDKPDNTLKMDKYITIEAWVNQFSQSDTAAIVTKGIDTTWTNNNYSAGLNNGKPVFVWGDQGSILADNPLSPANGWHYLAFVSDYITHTLKIYVDGQRVKQNNTTVVPVIAGEAQLNIGTDDGTTDNFNGIMDEIRISNTARSDTWIKASYYSGKDELITAFGKEENIHYAGVLKVTGFNAPQSISVNSSDGAVWIADKQNKEVVKLPKEGHKTIKAVVNESYPKGDLSITLTDVSELDSGINISFNNNLTDVYKIKDIIESETRVVISPGLYEALRGEPAEFGWAVPQLLEKTSYDAYGPQVAMDGNTAVAVWIQNDGAANSIYSNYSSDAGVIWHDSQLLETGPDTAISPQVAISGNNAVAVWQQNEGATANIYSNYSPDGGKTWLLSGPKLLEAVEDGSIASPQIAMSGDNAVALWQEFADWTTLGGFSALCDIYYDSKTGYLYVPDSGTDRIVKAKMDGSEWYPLSVSDTGDTFGWPDGIFYDSNSDTGYIYIANGGRPDRIIRTNIDGTDWTSYGSFGSGIDQFFCPLGIYYDSSSGFIYVADSINDRIVKTNRLGGAGTVWITYGSSGSDVGHFARPQGIYYDSSSGFFYIADSWNRIVKTKLDGLWTGWTTYGSSGSGVGQFRYPRDIYYDSLSGFIYVADNANDRIVKTKIDGTGWETYGSFTSSNEAGHFQAPAGIYYDSSSGFIYVADGNRIVKTKMGSKGNIVSRYSTDISPIAWGDTRLLEPVTGNAYALNPKVAISGTNAVAVWQHAEDTTDTTYDIYCNYSGNGGAGWVGAQPLESAAGNALNPQVVISENNAIAVWQQYEGTTANIYYNYSDNGGANWGIPKPLNPIGTNALNPQLAISENYAVAVWQQVYRGTYSIYSNYSTDGGKSWNTAQLIETGSRAAFSPQVAISGKNAVAIWSGRPFVWGSGDINSNYSTDGGKSWIGAQLLAGGDLRLASSPQVAISGTNAVAVWQQKDGMQSSAPYSIYADHTAFIVPPSAIPVGRELARISGFTNPVAVSVDSGSGDCWVADEGNNTVVWIDGDIGDPSIITTAGYNINTDSNYHRIIKGFDNPVSVAADPFSGACWVACQGEDGGDSYIVKLFNDVWDGYDISKDAGDHIKIYGFKSPSAVSIEPEGPNYDPNTGQLIELPHNNCWVVDKGNNQIVKLSPDGHKYIGLIVSGGPYAVGYAGPITLEPDPFANTLDAELYRPLKISFGSPTDTPIYEIGSVDYSGTNPIIGLTSPLTKPISSGNVGVYKELARVGGFSSPSDVSGFEGQDLGEGLHPWNLQVRELYVVDKEKYPPEEENIGWHNFPVNIPIHDATPQFRWQYISVDGTNTPLGSYQIHIYTRNKNGDFVPVWNSGELKVQNGVNIMPGEHEYIYTDWDKMKNATSTWTAASSSKENDSTGIYSAYHYAPYTIDLDDCPDLSQTEDVNTDSGDHTFYVQLTVTNQDGNKDTYPPDPLTADSSDTPSITFILDKTPPGSYKVCGTQELVPVPDNADKDYYNIKKNHDTPISEYYQTDNYYWDSVWVEWNGGEWNSGETEIVASDSPWIPTKDVTVRVKVKDKNNENPSLIVGFPHDGHSGDEYGNGSIEYAEKDTDCSGISIDAQYRYSLATSPVPRVWSEWKDCYEVRLFDEATTDTRHVGNHLDIGGERNTYVWLYAKNVNLDNGETNLIQFRVKDEGVEVKKFKEDINGNTREIWIAPNIGYSHADTALIDIVESDSPTVIPVEFQVASDIYGYQLKIDTDIPEVILIDYPSNPFPHKYASFKWITIDSSSCRYKWKVEKWDGNQWGPTPVYSGGGDYSDNSSNWDYDETATSFDGLEVGAWYRFWVKAKDNSGNPLHVSDDVIWVWYVSPEVPDTIITYGPSGQTIDRTPTFGWTGVGGNPAYYIYQYKLDGDTIWEDGPSGIINLPNLDSGSHIFEARVGDNNGFDLTPAVRIFTIVDANHPPYSSVSPKNLYKYFRGIGE